MKQAQEDLEAVQFTPHSLTGKKLMAKCRLLQEENDELGEKLAEGRIHKLEAELALQKEYCEELKRCLNGMNLVAVTVRELIADRIKRVGTAV